MSQPQSSYDFFSAAGWTITGAIAGVAVAIALAIPMALLLASGSSARDGGPGFVIGAVLLVVGGPILALVGALKGFRFGRRWNQRVAAEQAIGLTESD